MTPRSVLFATALIGLGFTPGWALAQSAAPAPAAPVFAAPFGDHAVLQRDRPAHVWGQAAPDAEIKLTLGDASATTRADAKGNWAADLPPQPAGGPYSLTVSDADGTTTLNDVMRGDVYLCGGQSNMQFPVKYATNAWGEIYVPANPDLRFMNIDTASALTPQDALMNPASWKVAGPETSGDASAVCYYMSQAIQKEQNVAVGFIDSYWGGTTAQAWISADTLKRIDYQGHIEPTQWAPHDLSSLYNAMIAPLTPYTIRAVAWYQGESNADKPGDYTQLLPALIADWRGAVQQPDLPFMIVQLSGFGAPQLKPGVSNWAEIREAQRRTAGADPHAALVVSLDFGDRTDIHPTEKKVIGQRLARAAQNLVYGAHVSSGGPEPVSVTRAGDDLIVHFKDAQGGLVAYSGATALGFETCDAADACHYVTATPRGDDLVLSDANRPDAARVRYAWANAPLVNLYGSDELPAVPFEMEISQ
jgi:sialate O-acetylesterase